MKWFGNHEKSSEKSSLDDVDLIESLREITKELRINPEKLRLNIPLGEGGSEQNICRNDIFVSDGEMDALWRVESLCSLFRGNRNPPPDHEMAHYPREYVMFFHGIESSVLTFCMLLSNPTDAEFLNLYTQIRRQPDGKSLGHLHDVIWQSAALALGMRRWSEAEYAAVFGQLARSCRHFKIDPSSRNYMAYLRQTFGR